jgi:hypothetical protein
MVRTRIEASTGSTRFVSRSPRMPDEGPPDYLSKLDSWFLELARLFREVSNAPAPNSKISNVNEAAANGGVSQRSRAHIPVAASAAWPRTVGGMYDVMSNLPDPRAARICSAMKNKVPEELLGLDLNDVLLNGLSLLRYQKTFRELQQSERKGDPKASRQIVRVMDLNNRWLHGQLPDGGVRFKGNPEHILFMVSGLPAGLERLTSGELVQFFDDNCLCREIHNQQVLQRLRSRLQNRLTSILQLDTADGRTPM